MPAVIALLTEIVVIFGRLLYFLYDCWNIFKWNFLYFIKILKGFLPFLVDIGNWIFEYIAILPSRAAEGVLAQFAEWINLALSGFSLGFIADAVAFPSVISSIPGLAYYTEPFQLGFGISVILTALFIRFLLKWVTQIPIKRLPRLPGPKWPQRSA